MDRCREGGGHVTWKPGSLGRPPRGLVDPRGCLEGARRGVSEPRRERRHDQAGDNLALHMFGAAAEFERAPILERLMAGLEAARARGTKGGRKPVMDEK